MICGNHLIHASITIFQELGNLLKFLARPHINPGQDLSKLDCNERDVATKDRGISVFNLASMVHDDMMTWKLLEAPFGWVILGVGSHKITLQILNCNIVTRKAS